MRIPLLSTFLGLLVLAALAQPAFAYDRDHDRDRGWHHEREWRHAEVYHPQRRVLFRYGYYAPVYYAPPVTYYAPPPVVAYYPPAYSVTTFRIF